MTEPPEDDQHVHYPPSTALPPAPAYTAPDFAAAIAREAQRLLDGDQAEQPPPATLRLRLAPEREQLPGP